MLSNVCHLVLATTGQSLFGACGESARIRPNLKRDSPIHIPAFNIREDLMTQRKAFAWAVALGAALTAQAQIEAV
ncbi:MAG TPA: hypothetical protein PLW27_07285, partial [Kiritimatiellia bacterium]|nr:hypothetical protein [Kiritimatiellia bacterium]